MDGETRGSLDQRGVRKPVSSLRGDTGCIAHAGILALKRGEEVNVSTNGWVWDRSKNRSTTASSMGAAGPIDLGREPVVCLAGDPNRLLVAVYLFTHRCPL